MSNPSNGKARTITQNSQMRNTRIPGRISRRPALFLALIFLGLPWARAQTYQLTDLGTLGGNFSQALSINDSGQVVGNANTSGGDEHAFLYSGGVMKDLGTLGGTNSLALAINDSGQIVGSASLANGDLHAFLYSNTMIDLGTLGGTDSAASDINNSGQIAGDADTTNEVTHAFLFSGGTMTDLNISAATNFSTTEAINDNGEIIGRVLSSDLSYALLDSNSVVSVLAYGGNIVPYSINDSGQIVGLLETSLPPGKEAFLYSDGAFVSTNLGTLGGVNSDGGTNTTAFYISNNGEILGDSAATNGGSHAFLYTNGKMVDLNSLIPTNSGLVLSFALGMNAAGQICGQGTNSLGQTHAFLLTPLYSLAIALSDTNVILTWPANWSGLILQTTTNLTPPATWTTDPTEPVVANGEYIVTNSRSDKEEFFRLSQ